MPFSLKVLILLSNLFFPTKMDVNALKTLWHVEYFEL